MSILISLALCFSLSILYGQDIDLSDRYCQTETVPMSIEDQAAYQQAMQNPNRFMEDSIIIPVVVHNLHWKRKGYVADSLIHSFLAQANLALANQGEFYDPEGLDTRIRLCLAAKDTLGQATSGILHYEHMAAINRQVFFERSIVWDTETYLNLHLTDAQFGVASFPWNVNTNFQGIMINTRNLTLKRGVITMAHEIGHYLGLWHTYEDFFAACSNADCLDRGDFVCDTHPKSQGYAFCFMTNSCTSDVNPNDPNNPFTSDQIDNPKNFMDAGTCRARFTPGQVARMHWAAETFLPNHMEGGRDKCNTCRPVEVDFSFEQAYGFGRRRNRLSQSNCTSRT